MYFNTIQFSRPKNNEPQYSHERNIENMLEDLFMVETLVLFGDGEGFEL